MNKSPVLPGTLYVVATPIGHLDDLGVRAASVLAAVDLVLAEDTRRTRKLLGHHGIRARLGNLHEHNEAQRVGGIVEQLRGGATVALVSDAGTPLINDPGFLLVRAAHAAAIGVVAVPGPSAAIAALSAAGVATHRFCFEGFLPARSRARRERLGELAAETRTLIFYEAPHRVADALADLATVFGAEREAALARELTKLHEQVVHATLGALAGALADGAVPCRGEFVVVVGGAAAAHGEDVDDAATDAWLRALGASLPPAEAARVAARATGQPRGRLYRRLLAITGSDEAC